ncbi:lanthionine synthetase C family protein [Dysgonomonas sp. HGC4]|nr:lanthionine synthetase C family protein [Dysgonomonas sp. HGC4]MBD8348359.1 lanthionine synthetase C family protein [Dysgonomonas sp. HGC4]
MKNRIKERLNQIADYMAIEIKKHQNKNALGLYNGEFGILLFLFYYSRYSKDPRFISLAETYSETLVDRQLKKINSHTFCSGLSGILYLFEFFRRNNFINIDISETQDELENYLIIRMQKDIHNQHYDFMHGALGVGLYFLEKKRRPEVILELIEYLFNTAEKSTNSILKWKSIIDYDKGTEGYNISLSHGISSIIIFLIRVLENNIHSQFVTSMLEGAVNYLFTQEINNNKYGSFYPPMSTENSQLFGRSRIGWCYGDLGVAIAIRKAGLILNRKEWIDKSLEVLLHTTKRLSPSETNVIDAGLCHGSAGNAMIFRHLYLETGMIEFSNATNYWIEKTLDLSIFDDGLAGYKSYQLGGWRNDSSLLTGIPGIGLVFISYLLDDHQNWDSMFLL